MISVYYAIMTASYLSLIIMDAEQELDLTWTAERLMRLSDALSSPRLPPSVMNIDKLDGYFYGVACCPCIVSPLLIYDDVLAGWNEPVGAEVDLLLADIMAFYNDRLGQFAEQSWGSHYFVPYNRELSQRYPTSCWAAGFLVAYQRFQEPWEQAFASKAGERVALDQGEESLSLLINASLLTLEVVEDPIESLNCGVSEYDIKKIWNQLANAAQLTAKLGYDVRQTMLECDLPVHLIPQQAS